MGSISTSNTSYREGEHYTSLPSALAGAPPVATFFSFLDSTSYDWATKHQVVQTIRRSVPSGTQVERFHATLKWSWDFGEALTHSWAVAKALHVDERVIDPLFEAVLTEKKVIDLEGIRAVFDSAGVPLQDFDSAWGRQHVLDETTWMDDTVRQLGIKKTPCIVVNGKHVVHTDAFGEQFNAEEIASVVRCLLDQD